MTALIELTQKLSDSICDEVKTNGARLEAAHQVNGVSARTWYRWQEKAKAAELADEYDDVHYLHWQSIKSADARVEIDDMVRVRAGVQGWAGTMTHHARKLPSVWGEHLKADITVTEPVQFTFSRAKEEHANERPTESEGSGERAQEATEG